MQKLEFVTDAGSTMVVEVDDANALGGTTPASNEGGVTARVGKTFEDALASIKPGIEGALSMLNSLATTPKEAEVEFGIKIDAAAGAIFAKAGAEATFKVKLIWKK